MHQESTPSSALTGVFCHIVGDLSSARVQSTIIAKVPDAAIAPEKSGATSPDLIEVGLVVFIIGLAQGEWLDLAAEQQGGLTMSTFN